MSARTTVTILLLATLVAPAAVGSTAPWVEGSVETSDTLLLEGVSVAEVPEGVVHLRTSSNERVGLELEAEAIAVTTTWERGYRADAAGVELARLYDPMQPSGTDEMHFSDATARIVATTTNPEVLAILAPGAKASGHAERVAHLHAVEDQYLTQVEWSDGAQTVGDGERPGFWYKVEGPDVAVSGLVGATVTGDFQLFINNVTVLFESADGSVEHWTGYREDASSPATHFESRVTVLRVRGGSLSLDTSDALSLVGSPVAVRMNGTASADRVQGVLNAPDLRYAYEGSRLELSGDGGMTVLPKAPGAADPLLLSVHPEGRYAVHRTPGVVVAPLPTEGPGEVDWLWMSGGILAIFVAAALMGARTRILATIDTWRATWAERSIATAMSTGDRLTEVRDYAGATRWYRRVTKKHPHYVEAWYSLGASLNELERHDEAATAFARANKLLGGDDPELLDLAAMAHWRAGEVPQATELFVALAKVDPERVARRLSEEDLSELRGESRLVKALSVPDDATASYV